MILVTQSWDDGVLDDLRLMDILRKYRARATFNLCPGIYRDQRVLGWKYKDHDVYRLSAEDVRTSFGDFEVASHSVTHPHLEQLDREAVRRELVDSRHILEDWFQRPIRGFAYPFGSFNATVKEELRSAGYAYARTVARSERVFPPDDPMEFNVNAHIHDPGFWEAFERSNKPGGVFYFWGHSYEMRTEALWADYEEKIARLSATPDVRWVTNIELFEPAPA
jgi:peptidoglycan/xylan/chitin deacetylase (PgdA/CDA1 family)